MDETRDPHSPADEGDRGFILVMLGLMIIPLMTFTALAVDVASWYNRTTELQKAADAASLAAVVWMPNSTRANQIAADTMAKNGFTNGVDNISISYEPGVDGPNTYRVVATDTKASTYFSKVFTDRTQRLSRGATATYDLPLDLGSPLNYYGGDASDYPPPNSQDPPGGDLDVWPSNPTCYYPTGSNRYGTYGYRYDRGGSPPPAYTYFPYNYSPRCQWTSAVGSVIRSDMSPGFWAAVEAPKTDAVQGDRFSPQCYGQGYCNSSYPNPDYRSTGYRYKITMPSSVPSKVLVQVFDASFTNRSQTDGTGDNWFTNDDNWYTNYRMYGPDDTPLDPSNNPAMTSSGTGALNCGGSSGSLPANANNSGYWSLKSRQSQDYKDSWRTLCTITNPAAGATYFMNVFTSGGGGNASNNYAVRVIASSSTTLDSNNWPSGALAQSLQPTLAAWGDMSMYNNLDSGTANFYLAKVPDRYAGKTLDVELYDPGDGRGISVTLNTPTGAQKGCTYSSYRLRNTSGGAGNDDGNSISPSKSETVISSSSDCKIATSGVFNGNALKIKVPIPASYTCNENVSATFWSSTPDSTGCWWSITYTSGGAHDNTTWTAKIEGDPVRLTQ